MTDDGGRPPADGRPSADPVPPAPLTWPRVRAAVVLVAILLAPVLVAALLAGSAALGPAVLGVVGVLLVVVQSGRSRVPWFVGATTLLLAATAPVVGTPAWVVVLALLGLGAGLASRRGLTGPLAAAGVLVSAAGALDTGEPVVAFVVYSLAAVWAHVALGRLGLPEVVPRSPVPARAAVALGVLLAAAAGAAGALSVAWGQPDSFYLPLFVFLLTMPAVGVTVSRSARQRVQGTLLGVLVALPLALWPIPLWLRALLTLVLLTVTVVAEGRLVLQAAATTLAVIVLLDPAGRGTEAGGARLVSVAVAAVLVLSVLALLGVLGLRGGGGPGRQGEDGSAPDSEDGTRFSA